MPGSASAARRGIWAPPLAWLPQALLEPTSALRSIAVGWAVAFPASILLAAVLQWVAPEAQGPEFPMRGLTAVLLLVLFSPIVETLIMGGVLLALLRFLTPTWAVVASAIVWGVFHSLAAPVWGLIIWWPFLVFSTLFVAWRGRSLALAFLMPMAVHMLQNLPPALLIASGNVV